MVRYDEKQYLLDTSPELRQAAIRHDVTHIDGVLYTHAHADHILGLDDLRRFNAVMQCPIPIYAEQSVLQRLNIMFEYIFHSHRNVNDSFVASLEERALLPLEPVTLDGATWTPLRLMHGNLPVLGFHVEFEGRRLAYCTDVSSVPDETMSMLQGVDVLVIDGLRDKPHPTHMTIAGAVEIAKHVEAGRAYLTHLSHETSHAELLERLPEHIEPAYDGLSVTV